MHISNVLNWFWLDLLCGVVSYLIWNAFTIDERMFSSEQQRNWNKTRTLHGNKSLEHGTWKFHLSFFSSVLWFYIISWPNKFIDSSNCICIKSQASEKLKQRKSKSNFYVRWEKWKGFRVFHWDPSDGRDHDKRFYSFFSVVLAWK